MNPDPLISIVIPVRNGAPFVPSAMDSIRAQDYPNLEVLMIDDGSTDGLAQKLKHCPDFVRYMRQEQQGPAAARNRGIRESTGGFIAFLDIDDLWTSRHLRTLLRALEENTEAGIAQGRIRQFWIDPGGRCFRTAPYRMPYLGACLFRRTVFRQCGLFDERMPYGEDYDLIFRCWEQDVVKVHVPEVSLLYRRHANNMTRGRNHAAHLLVIKRRIERIKAGVSDPAVPRRQVFQHYIGDQEPFRELALEEVSECELQSA
ncbi:MAG: glycosyltransferase [Bryobacteraceae bacterium]|jgi:glycosyltransferase involved in cell wall biosynthesis